LQLLNTSNDEPTQAQALILAELQGS